MEHFDNMSAVSSSSVLGSAKGSGLNPHMDSSDSDSEEFIARVDYFKIRRSGVSANQFLNHALNSEIESIRELIEEIREHISQMHSTNKVTLNDLIEKFSKLECTGSSRDDLEKLKANLIQTVEGKEKLETATCELQEKLKREKEAKATLQMNMSLYVKAPIPSTHGLGVITSYSKNISEAISNKTRSQF